MTTQVQAIVSPARQRKGQILGSSTGLMGA